MQTTSKFLIIGGATRNVGKTTLTCKIIDNFSKNNNIIGVKIKTINENDSFFHGRDNNPLKENENYRIAEEKISGSGSDGERMLVAGAKKVFKIKARYNYLKTAFEELIESIKIDNYSFVCESNSIVEHINSKIYFLIISKNNIEIKPSAKRNKKYADRIIFTNGKKHDFDLSEIDLKNHNWIYTK